jgi:BolA protein
MSDISTVIKDKLNSDFLLDYIEVIDETSKHLKHSNYQPGKYNIRLIISGGDFKNISLLESHRLIHESLSDLLKEKIHSLSIKILNS